MFFSLMQRLIDAFSACPPGGVRGTGSGGHAGGDIRNL